MFSVICCSNQPDRTAWVKHHYSQLLASEPYEFIHIPDARSLAEGYNRGIDHSHGEVLLFTHDDIEFLQPASWLKRLREQLRIFDLVGLVGTSRLIAR